MSNATIIATAFGEGADLYTILGIDNGSSSSNNDNDNDNNASQAQLRKAYYRTCLKYHPDKVSGKEAEFQAVTVAYNILKNDESRAEYNATGELVDDNDDDHDNDGNSFNAMKNYFSSIFGTVTSSKIDAFAETYKCSEEEESDVLKYYKMHKGNVGKMLENVMLSTEKDAQRWMEDYLKPAIASGQVPDYTKQLNKTMSKCLAKLVEVVEDDDDDDDDDDDATESEDDSPEEEEDVKPKKTTPKSKSKKPPAKKTRKTKAQREAEQAEILLTKIRGKSSLTRRQKGFDSMLSGLASKYGERMDDDDDDPLDDAAFQRIQAGLTKKKKSKK